MQEIKVTELKPHPQNDYFFDDMSGEKWTEFLESVKTSGVIEPVIITQNKVVVSGHQRIRACKELGIEKVWCEMRDYKDEDTVIKDLFETNIRQRGDVGGSFRKQGLRNKELERLYGVRNGRPEKLPNYSEVNITQQDLAKQNNQSVDTWNNAKKLAEAIPELDECIKSGTITKLTKCNYRKKSYTQRIAIAKKYEDKLKELAKENQLSGLKQNQKNRYDQMDTTEVTPIKVREEIKKIAKVSEGTLARYDVVMKSDEDDIKDKMLNTLYKNDKFKFLYNFKT